MRERRSARRVLIPAGGAALVAALGFFFTWGAGEDELLRKIKEDVFEQRWDAVLVSCDQFVTDFTRSTSLPRAYYYRAQAMEHIKGREADAIKAYGDFLQKFPDSPGTLTEDAVLSRMTMATSLYLKGDKRFSSLLLEGMDMKGYPRIYASIQGSKIDHGPARSKALPILQGCVKTELDPELNNECTVGVLRIKPESLPSERPAPAFPAIPAIPKPLTPPAPGSAPKSAHAPVPSPPGKAVKPQPGAAASAAGEAKLIRVEIFDKAKNLVSVRVNMPIAFAELALESLGESYGPMIDQHLKMKGVSGSVSQFLEAIKKGGKQTLVEVETPEESIKVWIE